MLLQAGHAPRENVQALIAECFAVIDEQRALVLRIDEANARARTVDGRATPEVLAERDTLAQRHAVLKAAVGATHEDADRYSPREIRWIPQIDVTAVQRQMDDIAPAHAHAERRDPAGQLAGRSVGRRNAGAARALIFR